MKKWEMVKQTKCKRIMQSGKTCTINCTILGSRLIWKEKIWLVLTKPYCSLANHNPEFQCEICTVLHFLHWYCITHFALALHILHSFLSQSEFSNFFVHVIVSAKNTTETLAVQTTHHFPKIHSAPGVEGLRIKMKHENSMWTLYTCLNFKALTIKLTMECKTRPPSWVTLNKIFIPC